MWTLFSSLNNPWILTGMLVVGMVVLVKGADWLVDGASALAKRFGISDLAIGLTVVAFGTSMPEFVVNMVSVTDGATDLAITNVLGSNIINTFVILGLTALVYPVVSQKHSRKFDIPMSVVASVAVFFMVMYHSPFDATETGIGRLGGLVLLLLFMIFLAVTFVHAKRNSDEKTAETIKSMSAWMALLLVLVGLIMLVTGGEMIVKSAVKIATRLGVSEAIIGLTIVALGTSLPELATSVVAASKKNSDIALGNVIGSNIFNVFLVLGVSATVHPLPAYNGIITDVLVAAAGSVLVWLLVRTNKEHKVKRWGGAILVLVYAVYLTYRLLTM